jgi:hypothetical protein
MNLGGIVFPDVPTEFPVLTRVSSKDSNVSDFSLERRLYNLGIGENGPDDDGDGKDDPDYVEGGRRQRTT